MKLRSHERPQQPRATDVFHQPEQNEWETFEAGHIIRKVIEVAQENVGGMEKLTGTPEGAVLLYASRPELIPVIFPEPKKTTIKMRTRFACDQTANFAMMQKIFAGEAGVPNVDMAQLEERFRRILMGLSGVDGSTEFLQEGVILTVFMPHKRAELQHAVQKHLGAWLKKMDLPDLKPNKYPASHGALLRLLDPSATARLKEILSRRAPSWIQQLEGSLSTEQISKYANRGLRYFLPWALRESLGLEILLADEALIDDKGNFVITHAKIKPRPPTPLPARPLN